MFSAPGGARTEIAALVDRLAAAAPDQADVAGVERAVGEIARVRAWLDAVEVRYVTRAEELAADGAGAGASGTLVASGNNSCRGAAKVGERAKAVADAPELGDALAVGDIGAEHVDALARATGGLDDGARQRFFDDTTGLAKEASRMPPDAFAQVCRRKARDAQGADGAAERLDQQRKNTEMHKGINPTSGMYWLNGDWDPLTGERLHNCVDAQARIMAKSLGLPFGPNLDARALAALVFRGARRAGLDGSARAPTTGLADPNDADAGQPVFDDVPAPGEEPLAVQVALDTLTDDHDGTGETSRGTPFPLRSLQGHDVATILALYRDEHGVIQQGHQSTTRPPDDLERAGHPEVAPPELDPTIPSAIELVVLVDKPPDAIPPAALERLLSQVLGTGVHHSKVAVWAARARDPSCQPCPTAGPGRHVPRMRRRWLHQAIPLVRDPPHRVLGAARRHRPRQPHPAVLRAPPPGPRPALDADPRCPASPHHHPPRQPPPRHRHPADRAPVRLGRPQPGQR